MGLNALMAATVAVTIYSASTRPLVGKFPTALRTVRLLSGLMDGGVSGMMRCMDRVTASAHYHLAATKFYSNPI